MIKRIKSAIQVIKDVATATIASGPVIYGVSTLLKTWGQTAANPYVAKVLTSVGTAGMKAGTVVLKTQAAIAKAGAKQAATAAKAVYQTLPGSKFIAGATLGKVALAGASLGLVANTTSLTMDAVAAVRGDSQAAKRLRSAGDFRDDNILKYIGYSMTAGYTRDREKAIKEERNNG